MRLKRTPSGQPPADPIAEGTALPLPALLGSWSATRWEYRRHDQPDGAIDVVCDLAGTVTLSLSADRYILAWSLAVTERQTIGGSYSLSGDSLEFMVGGPEPPERPAFRLCTQELSLSSEWSGWDFDGDGAEALASFVAVFVRL